MHPAPPSPTGCTGQSRDKSRTCSRFRILSRIFTSLFIVGAMALVASSAQAASIMTDTTDYAPGATVIISGSGFQAGETVTMQVVHDDGSPLNGQGHDPWDISADSFGGFTTSWVVPYDDNRGEVLRATADGQSSGLSATTTFTDKIGTNLDQLHNGTTSSSPKWANGNINGNNSCYAESDAVSFRYFVTGAAGGTNHSFVIQMEWTKGGIHAYDYPMSYDFSEAAKIIAVGGSCSNTATAAPGDCGAISESALFPDPSDSLNYLSGFSPGDSVLDFFSLVNTSFAIESDRFLKAYNTTNITFGGYYFTGTSNDRELNIEVSYTTVDTASSGFYWGGHVSRGDATNWGIGQGAASVGGAPYHMRAINFDNGGGANQDRSIQNGVICLPPVVVISCPADTACAGDNIVCTETSATANSWNWTISGPASINGSSTGSSISIDVNSGASPGDLIIMMVEACDTTSGCPGDFCCAELVDTLVVGNCCLITCPPDITIECDEDSSPVNTGSATITGGGCTVTFSDVITSGACANEWTITRTWSAIDGSSNVLGSCDQTITVEDNTAPVITCPANIAIECGSGAATGSATATDNCDPNPTITFSDVITTGQCLSDTIITRTWVATDTCGNSSSCDQIITIQDTAPPSITCPATATVECGDPSDPSVTGSATATDTCDPNPTITFTDAVTGNSCTGDSVITRTWTATDCSGNSASCDQTININDTTPPVITCPATATVECDNPSDPSVTGSATAVDGCDADPDISFSDVVTGNLCTGDSLITRTWTATDCSNNSASCDQLINIVDTQPPPLFCPPDIVIECNSGVSTGVASVIGDCDLDPIISFTDVVTPGQCPSDTTIVRTWTATDCSGNSSSCDQIITVQDTEPPIITCPATATVECGDPSDPSVTGSATVVDSCDANPAISFTDAVTGNSCTGDSVITRTWTATDCSGNSASCDQTINISDTTPPEITCSDTTFECSAIGVAIPASVTDICDPDPTISFVDDTTSGSCPQEFTIARSWTATDCSGNISDPCVQTITIQDTQAPVCALPDNMNFSMCQPGMITLAVDASDGCDNDVICQITSGPGAISGGNWSWMPPNNDTTITVTIRCEDDCGNSCEGSFTLTVSVNQPPVCTVARDTLMENCDTSQVCLGPFSVSDPDNNLKNAYLIFGDDTLNVSGQVCFYPDTAGVYRFICIAEDSCGVIVADTTVAVITCNTVTCIKITQTNRADDGTLLPGDQHTIQGDHEKIYIVHESGRNKIGAFDFLIEYDNSALAFTGAEEGNVYTDREWEFFTFRFGANGNCDGGCPSGKLRVIGLANQSGDGHTPLTYIPHEGDTLACLDFLVSNDRTLECQFVPIRFCWMDCGDNVLSDQSGDTLSISEQIFDYQGTGLFGPQFNRAIITNVNADFPTLYGAPTDCEISGGPGKPSPDRKVCYENGGIKIACADSIDARGDINLNGLSNEIADAVLYTKYFIDGPSTFTIAPQGQIAASDVNADGLPLTVADLVYMIRVIVGDALPIPKLTHNSLSVEFSYFDGVFSTSHDLGAALFVFDGRAEIDLLQTQLNLMIGYRDGRTYALIAPSLEGQSIGEYVQMGELIATDAPLLSIEASDYEGAMIEALSTVIVLPSDFTLHQNYPNPFNPATKFSFNLPEQTAYTLSVYNVSGQLVAEFDGVDVGLVEIEWNASSMASGMYFYKLSAGKFTSTRKALLLK